MPVKAAQQENQTEPGDTFNLQRPMNKHVSRTFGLLMGLSVVVLFLGFISLAPQIGQRLGKVSEKKQNQISHAAGLSAPCGQYGDVNLDGSVNSSDARLIALYVAQAPTSVDFNNPDVKKRADVDGNLAIAIDDSQRILKYAMGIDFTFPVCVDHDTDGFTDAVENYIRTDPYKGCGTNAWPPDITNDRKVALEDALKFQGAFLSKVGDANYNVRYDLVSDGIINNSDVLKLSPYFNTTCTIASKPVVNFSISESNIFVGQSITMIWATARTVAPCDASYTGPVSTSWGGQKQLSGSGTFVLSTAGTYTFTLTCYGPGGVTPVTKTVTVVANVDPQGAHDGPSGAIDCDNTNVSGWAYDPNSPSASIEVHIYVDGGAGAGVGFPGIIANIPRADVNSALGITGNHGFSWPIPTQYRSGSHSMYVYAINTPAGNNPILGGSPRTYSCQLLQPAVQIEPRGWPAVGYIGELAVHFTDVASSPYLNWEAIDVINSAGSSVYSTLNGKVVKVINDSTCGRGLDISNENFTVHYCHFRDNGIKVSFGQDVFQGQIIGEMGQTGLASANQVHYAVSPPAKMKPSYVPDDVCRYCKIENIQDSDIRF